MRIVRRITAVILGFVFFFAGFLKLMDPVGAALVVESWFSFLGMSFLAPASSVFGVAAALLETVCGAALISGVWRRLTAAVSGVMLAFFTLLTLAALIFNPVMDCGCFGEAVHLTHGQSFVKNLILDGLWALAFLPLSSLDEPVRKIKYVSFGISSVSLVLFTVYSLLSVPALDFTPYAPGVELMDQMDFVSDSSAPLLAFSDVDGEYCDSLALDGRVAIVSLYKPSAFDAADAQRIADFWTAAGQSGVKPLLLVAGTVEDLDGKIADPRVLSSLYFADRRTLMALNRSNGGATLVYDGQIIAKWPARALPGSRVRSKGDTALSELSGMGAAEAIVECNSAPRLKLQGFLLYVFAVLLLL
ncbi:MAG: DoxX family protein [Bacteroidales bacterium]|nr:DoxX family protein [Bacteroidales bacterium]